MALSERHKGTLYMVITAILFSFGGLGIKQVPWAPLAINGARNSIATVIIGFYLLRTKHKVVVNRSVLIGAASMMITTTLFVIANKQTTAANAIVLQFTAPVFLILIMWLFYAERPTGTDIVACIAVLTGIACFFIDGMQAGGMLGNVLALLSGVTYAGVFMMEAMPGSDSLSSILIGQACSALLGLPFLLRERDFSAQPVTAVLLLGIFQLGLAYIFLSHGLRYTTPVTAALTTGIEPILNPVWVALFFGEHVSFLSVVGGVIVVGSILIYNVKKARLQKTG